MVSLADTPAGVIARLDDAISRRYETVTLIKYTGDSPDPATETGVKAVIRPAKPEELIEGIDQIQYKVILSPTGIASVLPLLKGDKVVRAGDQYLNIEFPGPIYMADTLVRINLIATG